MAFHALFDLAGFSTFAARVPSVDAGLTPLILRTLGGNYVVEEATLGSTGFEASIVGIGDLDDRSVPLEQSVATMHRAMDFGLNVIDTAPSYEDGYSEAIVGAALQGRREGMFVIDKIDHLDQPVNPQVEELEGARSE